MSQSAFKNICAIGESFQRLVVQNRQYTKLGNVGAAGSITWDFPP